jgi:hypothetical protein
MLLLQNSHHSHCNWRLALQTLRFADDLHGRRLKKTPLVFQFTPNEQGSFHKNHAKPLIICLFDHSMQAP